MRIFTLIIALFFCSISFGQKTQLYDLQLEGPLTVEQCLNQIKHHYQIQFSYPSTLAGQKINPKPIRSSLKLDDYLTQLFLPAGIEFQLLANQQVLLRTKDIGETIPIKEKEISGTLLDAYSGEALIYALVTFNEQEAYAYTDEQGRFRLSIPKEANGTLKFHALGYQDQEFSSKDWINDRQWRLDLKEDYLSEITVLTSKPALILNNKDFGTQWRNAAPHLSFPGKDLFRGIQIMSGVYALDDFSAEVKIRGSSGDATLILVDEIPIYKAEHFYGIFSNVNGDYIDETSLYKNNLPAQYGGKTGGMAKLESQPKLETLTGNININLLQTSAIADIPVGKYVGLSLGGRASYLGLTQNSLTDLSLQNSQAELQSTGIARKTLLEQDPIFNFWDTNAKAYFEKDVHRMDFNFFKSQDDFQNIYENKYASNRFIDFENITESFAQKTTWDNQGFSLNYKATLEDWKIEANIYQTAFDTQDSINTKFNLSRAINPIEKSFDINSLNAITDKSARLSVQRKFEDLKIMGGLEQLSHDIDFSIANNRRRDIERNLSALENIFFTQINYIHRDKLHINVVGRAARYKVGATLDWAFSPQLDVRYLFNNWSWKASAGRHYQFVRELTFENRFGQSKNYFVLADKNIPTGYSNKFMTGLSYSGHRFSADLEFFYKDLEGLLEYSSTKVGFRENDQGPNPENDYRIFIGEGQVIGLDFTFNYQHKSWTQFLAYTLSKSTNQFPDIYNNALFPSREDSRHQLQYSSHYDWRDFSFFGIYVFGSGRPYTDLSKILTETDRSSLTPDQVISRLPDYHRVDAGVKYNFELGKNKASIGASVFNLFNRQNVKYVQYIYSLSQNPSSANAQNKVLGTSTNQLDRTFSVDFSLSF